MKNAVAQNRKARYEYELLEHYEAGIVLQGYEAKSILQHGINIAESYVAIENNEAWLINAHIKPYEKKYSGFGTIDATRPRKLLLSKREIMHLKQATEQKRQTIVPVAVYVKSSKYKIDIALARGKNVRDKRETIRRRDADREAQRDIAAYK